MENELVDNDIMRALSTIDAVLVGFKDRYGPTTPREAELALQLFTDTMTAQEANRLAWHQRTMQYAHLVAQRIIIDQNAHIMGFLAKLGETLQAGFTATDAAHRESMLLIADTIGSALGLEESPAPAPPAPAPAPPTPKLSIVPPVPADQPPQTVRKAKNKGSESPSGGADADASPSGGADA